MANRISRVHIVVKHNRKIPGIHNNTPTVPVSISFFTTHMIKTLVWHLTYHPLTLRHLIPVLLHMRNLLTPLKNNLQIIQKWSKFNCKRWCWWWCSIIWNKKKNIHSVTSLGAQVFIRTIATHKSFMINFHSPVKNNSPTSKNTIFVFKNMVKWSCCTVWKIMCVDQSYWYFYWHLFIW